jgi:hypothetical protein
MTGGVKMNVAEFGVVQQPTEKMDRNYQNGQGMVEMKKFGLPSGYAARPVTMDDVEAAVALFNTWSMAVHGVHDYKAEDLAREWKQPGFEMATDTQAVFAADGQMVGYYDVFERWPMPWLPIRLPIPYWSGPALA